MLCLLLEIYLNLYHFLGRFSRQQIDDIFLIFSSKQTLTFHANCSLHLIFDQNISIILGMKGCKLPKIMQTVVVQI